MSSAADYLRSEVDPVLAPIIQALLNERPRGAANIAKTIARYAEECKIASDDSILTRNIRKMTPETGFDVLVVCTSTEAQANFWQQRLSATRGEIAPKDCIICAVFEDWEAGGAGNGLGTLYAFQKAQAKAKAEFGIDLEKGMLDGSFSVGMYHTAGKGTRLAPIPGAENNNKPGVKLPGTVKAGGEALPLTILEAVIKQTGSYAPSRKGRLSVFWGDQVFVPSVEVDYDGGKYHADILACMGPMPSKQVWEEKGYSSYGLIAMGATGEGAQVEKVDFDTAQTLLSGLGEVTSVGPSLGSFSLSAEFLTCLSNEFAPELAAKSVALDSDPHFWMPMTLAKDAYIRIMLTKDMTEADAGRHHTRIRAMVGRLPKSKGLFGAVDVGNRADVYWWDYGQVAFYRDNNMKMVQPTKEAAAYRTFLGFGEDKTNGSTLGAALQSDSASVVLSSSLQGGSVSKSVLNGVQAQSIAVSDSILMKVTARKIQAEGALVYNVVDTSEEGIVLEKGDVLVGMQLPSGENLIVRSRLGIDGKKAWKSVIQDNKYTFEEVYKANGIADPAAIESAYAAAHAAAAKALGL